MLILLQGPPGSGKTSLAKRLSTELGILHISKDDILESIFNHVDSGDLSGLQGLPNQILFKLISKLPNNGTPVLVESNFHPEKGKAALKQALSGKDIKVIEVFLTAPDELLLKRFKERWESGVRHEGHSDNSKYEALKSYLAQKPRPLSFAELILEINTAQEEEAVYQEFLDKISGVMVNLKHAHKTAQ